MIDHRLDKLAATLRDALKHHPKMPLRRHKDDDYVDRIRVQAATGAELLAYVRPRYKTSGLSGDEWRVSHRLEVRSGPSDAPIIERGFHAMGGRRPGLAHYAPHFVYTEAPSLLSSPRALLHVERKGHVIFREEHPTFGAAVMGLAWHIVTANEGREGVDWHHLTDAEEMQHCQQVGCAEPPVNFYRLKQINYAPGHAMMAPPKYDFEGQFTWYCGRHTVRGDCGLEDADANLELVAGPGTGSPNPSDESPSAFGGVMRVDVGEG